MSRKPGLIAALALASAAVSAPADAEAAGWAIHGRGFGHGVGMSAYGAYGLAQHGSDYRQILHRYYQNTHIGKARGARIKVLLGSGLGSVRFAKANGACGHHLRPRRAYRFVPAGSGVALANKAGRTIASCGSSGFASGGPIHVLGRGTYRGQLVARGGGGIELVNKVGIEGYVKGVVPNEFPPSWSQAALRVEAVAARTFALAQRRHGTFDVYDDTRSQVYKGKGSEYKSTDLATHATRGTVVTYNGHPVTTYYSSSSGGHTEDIQYAFIGASPEPWLEGVKDPYDSISPYHTWTAKRTNGTMASDLSGLYSGRLRHIKILKTGVSPRIVYARVVGSRGGTRVSGPTLESRIGLMSTWARFKRSKAVAKNENPISRRGMAAAGSRDQCRDCRTRRLPRRRPRPSPPGDPVARP